MTIRALTATSFRAPEPAAVRAGASASSPAAQPHGYPMTDAYVGPSASKYALLGDLHGADVETLAFATMMNAARAAQEDLKAIMDGVRAASGDPARIRTARRRDPSDD